jgi:hypothetical protein
LTSVFCFTHYIVSADINCGGSSFVPVKPRLTGTVSVHPP